MRRILALAAVLAAARAFAGPTGANDPNTATATGFPAAYLATVQLSLRADPRYGSRLLDALDEHLQAVGVMTGPREVAGYLEQSAGGSEGVDSLRASLGRETLDPLKAAAILLADALARPAQFREVLEGLESLKPGAGLNAAKLLRGARGTGDKRLFAALHEAGQLRREVTSPRYRSAGWFAELFDGESTRGADGVVLAAPGADAPDAAAAPAVPARGADPAPARP